MPIEVDGKIIATTASAFLEDPDEWSKTVAETMAAAEGLELTAQHWDVIDYLRKEYFENNGHQPNNRTLLKEMSGLWGHKVNNKELFNLFPGNPSKQAGRLSGLPESMRKGGY